MYDASEANDSMENVRLDQERRERDADQMENVRACCDGGFSDLPTFCIASSHF